MSPTSPTQASIVDAFEQRRHLLAIVGASAVSAVMMLWLSYGAAQGFMSWSVAAAATVWSALSLGSAFILLRTGLNQRLRNPGMMLPMVLAATVCVLGVAHQLAPAHRSAILPWMCMAFAFGAFSARIRTLVVMTSWVSLLLLIESSFYVLSHGHLPLIAWQGTVIFASILCTGAFCGILNEKRAVATKRLSQNKTVLDSVAEAVVSLDLDGKISELNRAAERLTKTVTADARGRTLADLLLPNSAADLEVLRGATLLRDDDRAEQSRFHIQSNLNGAEEAIRLECTPAAVKNRKGAVIGEVLVLRDVSEAAKLLNRLEYDSNHDELTGLLNRRGFQVALAQTVGSLEDRSSGAKHAILIVDLDQFKIVNDTCGHAAGDSLLKRVAEQLRASVRPVDVVARYGGDEFAIIVHNVGSDTALAIAESVLQGVGKLHFEWGGRRFKTGASIGCAMTDESDTDFAKIIRKADSALYLAKELGRGRVQLHADGDEQIAKKSRELEWACRINDALEDDSFVLYAQKVSCNDKKFEDHFEILVRMRESDGQLIAPGEFLPAAERFNLMPSIDRWVVRKTLAMLDRAVDAREHTPKVAINLSAQSINDRDFLPFLMDELHQSRVPSDRICFELTETVAIANFETARVFVESVRALGCTFALDDVGAGFNSFNYLKVLTFDTIKIDGHYIRNFEQDPVDRALVQSLVHAASSLGLVTVAEMVETEATAADLKRMGVDQLQGFGIHRPEPFLTVLETMIGSAETAPSKALDAANAAKGQLA